MKKTIKLISLIVWMSIIFILSNDTNSNEVTHAAIKNVFNIYNKQILEIVNYIIRKCAHITEYLILFFLIKTNLKEYKINPKKALIISIIFCLLYSISDEYHQYLVGRTGEFKDVLIDMLGITIISVIYILKSNKLKYIDNKQ